MDHDDVSSRYLVEGYLLNDLNPFEREEFESHLFECAICAGELTSLEEFREALRDNPEFGERFQSPHAAAAYVLNDLAPAERERFEAHMTTCKTCTRNAQLGAIILKDFMEQPAQPYGSRLLNALLLTRWFRLAFKD
jgi:anti-sigma factor RsiW